jgi:sugar phosphate permease
MAVSETAQQRPTAFRHVVLWLTVLAYLITYIDRVVIGSAMTSIEKEFGFSAITVGWILGAFQISYAMFQIPGGWLGDKFGPRRALTGVVVWWSAFTALTAMTWSAGSMIVCRFLFGMGEAGAFPIATRSLSRWMLPAERGYAQGLTHAGARLGGALAPVLVVMLIASFGWRFPFLLFALVGLAWAALWFVMYRDSPNEHPSVNGAEREKIAAALGDLSKASKASVPWRTILSSPQLWILCALYFCYAYDINIFLTWFPKYLASAHGFDLIKMGMFASLPLMAGVCGDILGGVVSDHIAKSTGNLAFGRRIIGIVGFAVSAIAIPFGVLSVNPYVGVAWFCLAVFALELTVGVSWAMTLDMGGNFAGSVSAVMNTCGNIGGTLAAVLTGYIFTAAGWVPAFLVLSGLAVIAALCMFIIDPRRQVYLKTAPQPA